MNAVIIFTLGVYSTYSYCLVIGKVFIISVRALDHRSWFGQPNLRCPWGLDRKCTWAGKEEYVTSYEIKPLIVCVWSSHRGHGIYRTSNKRDNSGHLALSRRDRATFMSSRNTPSLNSHRNPLETVPPSPLASSDSTAVAAADVPVSTRGGGGRIIMNQGLTDDGISAFLWTRGQVEFTRPSQTQIPRSGSLR